MFDLLINWFMGQDAWLCVAPTYQVFGQEYKFDYCDGISLGVQIQIQVVTSWVLYIATAIACFQMILKSIFGTAPLFGLAGDEAQREVQDQRAMQDRQFENLGNRSD